MHKTNATGQLRPLGERMNKHQQERRKQRIQGRARVAAQLMGNMNQLGNYMGMFIGMPFYRRVLWLLFGSKSLAWFR